MDSTLDTQTTDPSTFQNLLGGSAPSLVPESLATTLTVGFIVLNVLGLLFFIFYVVSLVRKWKVESAVLHIQKDLAEIKASLAGQPNSPAKATEPIVQPAQQNRTIAASDSTDSDQSTSNFS